LLAEASLQALDLSTSETAFVQCKDYHGIKLVKQLANINDIVLKQAEVAVYFGDYVKAEQLYIEADRKYEFHSFCFHAIIFKLVFNN